MTDKELLKFMEDLLQSTNDMEIAHIKIDAKVADVLEQLGYKESALYYRSLVEDSFWYA